MDNEKKKLYTKKYREDNKEKIKLKSREYRENNREKISLQEREYRKKNIQRYRNYGKTNYINHKEKRLNYAKEYKINNREKINLNNKKYTLQNKARNMVTRDKKKNPQNYPKECCFCGETENIEYHHPAYNFPLSVYPVCRKHHNQIHSNEVTL